MKYKEPAPEVPPRPVEPAPEPEIEMDDATRAFDTGNTGPASIEEQELLEDIRAAEERNPGGVAFARMIIESMNKNDQHRRAR
jgi:hypothetical protein